MLLDIVMIFKLIFFVRMKMMTLTLGHKRVYFECSSILYY